MSNLLPEEFSTVLQFLFVALGGNYGRQNIILSPKNLRSRKRAKEEGNEGNLILFIVSCHTVLRVFAYVHLFDAHTPCETLLFLLQIKDACRRSLAFYLRTVCNTVYVCVPLLPTHIGTHCD